jgi:hypothetical protein
LNNWSSPLQSDSGLAFLGCLGVKITEDRLALPAAALGTFVFPLLPLFYGKRNGVLLVALLALELVVWHGNSSFKKLCYWTQSEKGHRIEIFSP